MKPIGGNFHMAIDLREALREFREAEWRGCCTDETGQVMTPLQVHEHFEAELAKGRKVIPWGGPCSGFDFQGGGCPGHSAPGSGQ